MGSLARNKNKQISVLVSVAHSLRRGRIEATYESRGRARTVSIHPASSVVVFVAPSCIFLSRIAYVLISLFSLSHSLSLALWDDFALSTVTLRSCVYKPTHAPFLIALIRLPPLPPFTPRVTHRAECRGN